MEDDVEGSIDELHLDVQSGGDVVEDLIEDVREAEDPVVEVVDDPEAVVDRVVGKVVGGAESLQGVAGGIGGER